MTCCAPPRDEVLLEPGSERPRRPSAQRADVEAGDVRANFIAAARRAAQAAASEAASAKKATATSANALGGTPEPGESVVARCECTKLKRRIAFTRGTAFVGDKPIAYSSGTFMIGV